MGTALPFYGDNEARVGMAKMKVAGLKEVPETRLAQKKDEDKSVQFKDVSPYSWGEFES